jgi:hypothetical protein
VCISEDNHILFFEAVPPGDTKTKLENAEVITNLLFVSETGKCRSYNKLAVCFRLLYFGGNLT